LDHFSIFGEIEKSDLWLFLHFWWNREWWPLTLAISSFLVKYKIKNSIFRLLSKEWHDMSGHAHRPPSRPPKRRGSLKTRGYRTLSQILKW
jgi:hypothetical protein